MYFNGSHKTLNVVSYICILTCDKIHEILHKNMKHIHSRDWLIGYFKMLNGKLNFLHNFKRTVTRRPFIAEGQVLPQVIPCGICGGRSGPGTGFSPSTSTVPRQHNSTGFPCPFLHLSPMVLYWSIESLVKRLIKDDFKTCPGTDVKAVVVVTELLPGYLL
jgi:hypothetical protein